MESYPNFKEEVGGLIFGLISSCDISSLLDRNLSGCQLSPMPWRWRMGLLFQKKKKKRQQDQEGGSPHFFNLRWRQGEYGVHFT